MPAYTFPRNRTDLAVLRVVVRRGFSHDMADLLVGDLVRQLPRLEKQAAPLHDGVGATGFITRRRPGLGLRHFFRILPVHDQPVEHDQGQR